MCGRGRVSASRGAVDRVRPWIAVLAMGAGPAAAQSADPAGTLDDVVVSASRSAQRAFDAPAAVQAVDGDAVRAAGPGFDPSEALARVPGLVVQDRQNLAQDPQVSIRGFGARSTFGVRGLRLIVDGIPATMPDGQGQLSTVPLTAIDRIEVLRGPLAQLYGNAAGGVVQVFTREGESPPRAGGEFFAGSFGTLRGALSGSTRADGFAGRVDATAFRTDGWRAWSEATRRQLDARLDWILPAGTRVAVVAGAFDQPLARDPGGLTRAQLDADPRQASPASVAQQAGKTVSQQQLGLRVEHAIDADRRFAVRVYGGQRDLDQALAVPLAAQLAPTASGGYVGLDRGYAGLGLQWSQRTRLGATLLEWTAGLDVDTMRERRRGWVNDGGARGDLKRDEDNRVSSTDAYVQAAWRLGESWSVIAGARTSRVRFVTEDRYVRTGNPDDSGQADYSATHPVAGVVWHASDRLNVYANLGRGFETPTFAELAYRPVGSGLNFGLAAARSRHAELGAKWRTPTGGRLDLAVFDVRTEDEIVVASNTGGRAVFRNAGRTQRRGLELAWTELIGRAWRARLALTALDATFLDASGRGATAIAAGNALPGAPPRRVFAELAWQPSADRGPFAAAALVHGGSVFVDDANTDSAAAWTVVHLRAGLRQRMGRWRFSQVLHVENAGGRSYVGSVIVNESNQRYFESAPTRTWAFGVTTAYVFD